MGTKKENKGKGKKQRKEKRDHFSVSAFYRGAIRFHAETTDHDIHPDYVEILERNVNNRKQRLFLEALHSIQDFNCVNEHVQFPQVYLTLGTSLETGAVYKKTYYARN